MTAAPIPWSAATDLVFLAEQVSHHPPVSAFYAECQARNISFTGHIYTKSAFLGLSVAVSRLLLNSSGSLLLKSCFHCITFQKIIEYRL